MELIIALRWLLAAGALVGLLSTFNALWDSLGDLQAVRLGGITNGRRLLACSLLAWDVALIIYFKGTLALGVLILFAPLNPMQPDVLWWATLRLASGLVIPVWVLAWASLYGNWVRRRLRAMHIG